MFRFSFKASPEFPSVGEGMEKDYGEKARDSEKDEHHDVEQGAGKDAEGFEWVHGKVITLCRVVGNAI